MPLNKSWHEYNETLIERGRILMDIGFLRSSNREIKNMNKGKVGAPFEYSRTYIQFLAFLKIGFNLHIAVDAKSKIISFRITKGNVHDSKKFSPMIREVSEGYEGYRKKMDCRNCPSKKFKAQKVEAGFKVMLYNKFIGL